MECEALTSRTASQLTVVIGWRWLGAARVAVGRPPPRGPGVDPVLIGPQVVRRGMGSVARPGGVAAR